MRQCDWWYDDMRQVGLDFSQAAQVQTYDARQGTDPTADATLLRDLGLRPGQRMADIGCGTGSLVCEAARIGAEVYAIDVSDAMLAATESRAQALRRQGVVLQHGGVLSAELPEASFDLITSKAALHHLPDMWKAVALARIFAALKPGGRFYLRDVAFSCPVERLPAAVEAWAEWMVAETGYSREDVAGHVRDEFSTFGWILEGLIEAAGFRLIRKRYAQEVYAEYIAERPH